MGRARIEEENSAAHPSSSEHVDLYFLAAIRKFYEKQIKFAVLSIALHTSPSF